MVVGAAAVLLGPAAVSQAAPIVGDPAGESTVFVHPFADPDRPVDAVTLSSSGAVVRSERVAERGAVNTLFGGTVLGDAIVVWSDRAARGDPLVATARGPGGGFGPRAQLARRSPDYARAAVGDAGHAIVMWQVDTDLFVATREPGGGFGPAQQLGEAREAWPAIDGSGVADDRVDGSSQSRDQRHTNRQPDGAAGRRVE